MYVVFCLYRYYNYINKINIDRKTRNYIIIFCSCIKNHIQNTCKILRVYFANLYTYRVGH